MRLLRKVSKAAAKPIDTGHLLFALLKGWYWRLRCHWFSRHVRIGKGFKVVGTFRPHGPGRLCLGDNVFAHWGGRIQ